MGVIAIIVWQCDACGRLQAEIEETSLHSDVEVGAGPGREQWDFIGEPFKERLACPPCVAKEAKP